MTSNIRDLNELLVVAANDYFLVSDTSDPTDKDKRISQVNMVGAAITGGGGIALGGFTLTVPATGTAALLARAQTFTAAQTIQTTGTTVVPLVVNGDTALNTALQQWNRGATPVAYINGFATDRSFNLSSFDNGSSVGPYLNIGLNNNASTPAAGMVIFGNLSGIGRRVWVDAAGNLRIHNANITNALDTAGVVVGAQTSQLAAKTVLGDGIAPAAALSKLLATPVVEFEYKSKAYNATRFHGIVSDWSPEFAMDDNRSFNPISAFGYSVQAIKELERRLAVAESELAMMRGE